MLWLPNICYIKNVGKLLLFLKKKYIFAPLLHLFGVKKLNIYR